MIELALSFIGWQVSAVRLHRASAIETGLFEIQGEVLLERRRPTGPVQQARWPLFGPMAIAEPLARTDEAIRRPAIKNRCPSPGVRARTWSSPTLQPIDEACVRKSSLHKSAEIRRVIR